MQKILQESSEACIQEQSFQAHPYLFSQFFHQESMEQYYIKFLKNSSDVHERDVLIGREISLGRYLRDLKAPYKQPYLQDSLKGVVRLHILRQKVFELAQ